jgi:hypothetical protein
MRLITRLSILLVTVSWMNTALAQDAINTEKFTYTFKTGDTSALLTYNGKSHAFSFAIPGKGVTQQDVDTKQPNQVFINAGKTLVQVSLIPLPQPIAPAVQLSSLTDDQIKGTLENYVQYEIDYMKNDLKLNPHNLKKEWRTISGKLVLVWYFEFDVGTKEADKTVTAQAYISSICYNQVVDLNIPLYTPGDADAANTLLAGIQASLKTFDKPANGGN